MLSKRGGLLFLENHGVDSNGKGSVLIGGQAYISMSGTTHFKTRGINWTISRLWTTVCVV